MPRIDQIIGDNFNHVNARMVGMGSDANASLYMTQYVNVNIYIRGNRFLTFYFPLDPVIISLYFSTVRYSMAPGPVFRIRILWSHELSQI
jgi:hypothetical protein